MAKKLIYEFVKSEFEKEGYILLSKEYTNARTKLNYECVNGHFHSITWDNWKQGKRCPKCRKIDIETVRRSFEDEGYTLLSDVYYNNRTKMDFICSNGHRHSINWNDWKDGHRCAVCAGLAKPLYSEVKASFEVERYVLLSKEYHNAKTKLDCICPNGHHYSVSWHNWCMGIRCPICHKLSLVGAGNPAWKGGNSFEPYCPVWKDTEFKEYIKERDGYRCLNPYCYHKDVVLSIHHIDYDKKNCHPLNLITLCRSCNSRANKDRRWHKAWYSAIMNMRYADRSITYGK